ncbi:MAG: hypothetical protein ACO3YN_08525, partial [Rubrivivax sp.]
WWRARAEPTPMQGLLDGPVEPVFAAQVPAGEVSSPSAAPSDVPAAPQPSANPLTPASVAAVDALSGIQARPHPLEEDPEAMSERTRLMPSATAQGSAPLQAVSMEELLELEQHVEFLVVLGQERAAAAQLTDHLQRTGGAYPLPYLKLMEIQRRIGDEQGYETLRAQFNQRFNAVAPAFGAQVQVSRGLEDYPASLVQIERLWGRPVDAMALLENLLFRNRDGEFFDLAALGDVVFLYTLARDLERHAGASTLEVDVLLMLEEEAAAPPSTTQPTQSQAIEWSSVDVPMIEEAPSGGSGAVAPPRIIKSARL